MDNALKDKDVAAVVHAMDVQFMQNIAAKDVERLVKGFHAEDARLLPPNQASVTGRAVIEGVFDALIALGLQSIAVQTTFVDVRRLGIWYRQL